MDVFKKEELSICIFIAYKYNFFIVVVQILELFDEENKTNQ